MIKEFYEDSEVFITGGSGVVGKAVIEKLLRSCNVRRIYVLLRSKRNFSTEQRLENMRNDPIFARLRTAKPDELDKLVAVPGDVSKPKLDIAPERAKQMAHVSIILHCAATVRFDEPLKVALKLNVGGTYEALKFAETLKQLRIFLHVSTFYSNPYLTHVESKMYEPPMDWRLGLKLLEDDSQSDIIDIITKKLITGFPNTYTFTKNLAESLVNDHRDRLPVAVYRPSIVLFSFHEPEPGYAPGDTGASGLFALVAAGMLKTVYLSSETRFDITPMDVGVKCLLVYTVHGASVYQDRRPAEVPVYMCSSVTYIRNTFNFLCEIAEYFWNDHPVLKSFLLPGCTYTSCRFYYLLLVATKQILPAIMMDALICLFGRKPVLMGIQRKSFHALEVMKPFLFNTWTTDGFEPTDPMFTMPICDDFAIKDVLRHSRNAVIEFTSNMIAQQPRLIFKEDANDMEKARNILFVKKCVHQAVKLTLSFYTIRWLYNYYLHQSYGIQ